MRPKRAYAPLRAALIVDGPRLWRWAVDALALAIERGRIEIAAIIVRTPPASRTFRAFVRTPRAGELHSYQHLLSPDAAPAVVELQQATSLDLDIAISFSSSRDLVAFPARHGVLSWSHLLEMRPLGFE